jgi:hypothetical protein
MISRAAQHRHRGQRRLPSSMNMPVGPLPHQLRRTDGDQLCPLYVDSRSGSGWAYRQPVDKFAQAAIVESPKRILLPSATCQIERASEVDGALKVTAECADSISYTSRSTVIMLRSATELVYGASGDAVLATTLKKCTP